MIVVQTYNKERKMRAKELCYKIEVIPDLSLNKYSSLDGNGVEGVLKKHLLETLVSAPILIKKGN